MYLFEREVRALLETLHCVEHTSKESVRAVLLARKLENLLKLREQLKKSEGRALHLLRKVDYSSIVPHIIPVAPEDMPVWRYCRHVISSAPFLTRPARAVYFFCIDRKTNGVLGILDIGSEMQSLGPRDRYIAWSYDKKWHYGLNHIANMGTCVSVEPFGQLCGGKFQAVAMTSSEIGRLWQKRYGDELAAISTTSLYGKSSVYNRLAEYKYLGNTPGIGVAHVSADDYKLLKQFVIRNNLRTRVSGALSIMSQHDVITTVCSALNFDIKRISSHQPRGVYFAQTGVNALEYLRDTESTKFEPYERDIAAISEWYLQRWYKPRYEKKLDVIDGFSFDVYQVDAQIDLCRSAQNNHARLEVESDVE